MMVLNWAFKPFFYGLKKRGGHFQSGGIKTKFPRAGCRLPGAPYPLYTIRGVFLFAGARIHYDLVLRHLGGQDVFFDLETVVSNDLVAGAHDVLGCCGSSGWFDDPGAGKMFSIR